MGGLSEPRERGPASGRPGATGRSGGREPPDPHHLFGYASLAGELAGRGTVATLRGHRRVWGVAADNERAIPGYKRYRSREDGSLPRVYVAFLDVVADAADEVNGVVAPVGDDELARTDRRERNYDRVEVTALLDSAPARGRVWTYVGSAAGRARLAAGAAAGRAVVCRDYLDDVDAAFRALGEREHARFLASTDLDALPVMDLERVDLPAEPPR